MFTKHIAALLGVLSLILLPMGQARAEDAGRGITTPLFLASYLVTGGIYEFYQVYERWPSGWAEVANSGLVQAPLLSDSSEGINPDDGRLDFFGDVLYTNIPGVRGPEISLMLDSNLANPTTTPLTAPLTFRELFDSVPVNQRNGLPSVDDKPRLLQMALVAMCHEGISRFASAHGNTFPGSWEQYLDSGFAPIIRTSHNWMTGDVFYGDGRANDIFYDIIPTGFEILATDDNRNLIRLPFEVPVCPWQCARPAPGYEQLR